MPVDWVVVGVDNGGTTNNGTVLDPTGRFLLDQMAEVPSNVREGPDKAIQSLVDSVEQVLGLTGVPIASVRAVGLDTPGPASADGVISSKGATNFGDAGLGRLRHPQRAGRTPRAARHLQQRRERGRALRAPRPVRRRIPAVQLGLRDRGYRARRRARRGRAGDQGSSRDGRGARARPHPDGRPARPRPADAGVQLRSTGRCGERRLAHRHPEEPAAVLAQQVRAPRARRAAAGQGRQARPPVR